MEKTGTAFINDAQLYAYYAYRLVEGDDVLDGLFKHLREDGFVDEGDEWIYQEEGE